jgi:hypothetical protein
VRGQTGGDAAAGLPPGFLVTSPAAFVIPDVVFQYGPEADPRSGRVCGSRLLSAIGAHTHVCSPSDPSSHR